MTPIPPFSEGQIEGLAKLLGDCGTGSDIEHVLRDRGLADNSHTSTKWRRLYWVFLETQRQDQCANRVLDFIRAYLTPARYVGRQDEFEQRREELNALLSFSGLEYGRDGQFRQRDAARTLDEAERRLRTIRTKFRDRRLHPEVEKYCTTELLQENYFHAIFEATKGLAQRMRQMTGVDADGAALVDRVFSVDLPLLAFNTLQTDTERSRHKGFAMLFKGCITAVRNPLAHEPKVFWQDEDNAADYLTLVSLLHRKLDECVPTGLGATRER